MTTEPLPAWPRKAGTNQRFGDRPNRPRLPRAAVLHLRLTITCADTLQAPLPYRRLLSETQAIKSNQFIEAGDGGKPAAFPHAPAVRCSRPILRPYSKNAKHPTSRHALTTSRAGIMPIPLRTTNATIGEIDRLALTRVLYVPT